MAEFRKKPVVIEAVYFDGSHYSADRVLQWTGPMAGSGFVKPPGEHLGYIEIPTMEGVMRASPGDWIIRGVKGELCPCKPDIFAATYEPAADRPPQPAPADLVGAVERIIDENTAATTEGDVAGIPEAAQAIAALVHAESYRAGWEAALEACAAYLDTGAELSRASRDNGLIPKSHRDAAALEVRRIERNIAGIRALPLPPEGGL
jgi:hypothetical protein